jgi:hypothetical protein
MVSGYEVFDSFSWSAAIIWDEPKTNMVLNN